MIIIEAGKQFYMDSILQNFKAVGMCIPRNAFPLDNFLYVTNYHF